LGWGGKRWGTPFGGKKKGAAVMGCGIVLARKKIKFSFGGEWGPGRGAFRSLMGGGGLAGRFGVVGGGARVSAFLRILKGKFGQGQWGLPGTGDRKKRHRGGEAQLPGFFGGSRGGEKRGPVFRPAGHPGAWGGGGPRAGLPGKLLGPFNGADFGGADSPKKGGPVTKGGPPSAHPPQTPQLRVFSPVLAHKHKYGVGGESGGRLGGCFLLWVGAEKFRDWARGCFNGGSREDGGRAGPSVGDGISVAWMGGRFFMRAGSVPGSFFFRGGAGPLKDPKEKRSPPGRGGGLGGGAHSPRAAGGAHRGPPKKNPKGPSPRGGGGGAKKAERRGLPGLAPRGRPGGWKPQFFVCFGAPLVHGGEFATQKNKKKKNFSRGGETLGARGIGFVGRGGREMVFSRTGVFFLAPGVFNRGPQGGSGQRGPFLQTGGNCSQTNKTGAGGGGRGSGGWGGPGPFSRKVGSVGAR